jgi:hypothetical protein
VQDTAFTKLGHVKVSDFSELAFANGKVMPEIDTLSLGVGYYDCCFGDKRKGSISVSFCIDILDSHQTRIW